MLHLAIQSYPCKENGDKSSFYISFLQLSSYINFFHRANLREQSYFRMGCLEGNSHDIFKSCVLVEWYFSSVCTAGIGQKQNDEKENDEEQRNYLNVVLTMNI